MNVSLPNWAWNTIPWVIEAIGIVIVIVWTVIPIREFADIYRRVVAQPPAAPESLDEPETEREEIAA